MPFDERARLTRLLTSLDGPPELPVAARRRRAFFLTITTVGALVLLPWVVYLALTLSERPQGGEWRWAWVGFDIALALALGTTAILGWLERQMVLVALVVTGVLLCCDAWFDLTLSWGTGDQWTSVATALLIEVPMAVLMFRACHRLLRGTIQAVRLREGRLDPAPPLRKLPLTVFEHQSE